jgi:uncharacterized protein YdeI (YjbR/CyaY-like superfamily)
LLAPETASPNIAPVKGSSDMKALSLNPQIDSYMASAAEFAQPILAHLRTLLHKTCPSLVEEMKWGIPHFDYKDEMMCIVAAYKSHCSFTFWKESLMSDPMLKANPNLKSSKRHMGKITMLSDLPPDWQLVAYIKEAMVLNENGVRLAPRKSEKPKEIAVPDYFAQQLAANAKAKEIFDSKSASFRKDYLIWIVDAKTEATRQKRIEESLAWIADGKGRFWKYEK